jgi:hypothetical protein
MAIDERRAEEIAFYTKNREDMYRKLQKLWDRVDLHDFRYYTEQLTCKLEGVIEVQGLATIN